MNGQGMLYASITQRSLENDILVALQFYRLARSYEMEREKKRKTMDPAGTLAMAICNTNT